MRKHGDRLFGDLCSSRACCRGDEEAPQVKYKRKGWEQGWAEPPSLRGPYLYIVCLFPSRRQQNTQVTSTSREKLVTEEVEHLTWIRGSAIHFAQA